MTYRYLSLFSGIGGFELAAQIANSLIGRNAFEAAALCEINPFCQQVLQHHFPLTPLLPDVTRITVDLIRELGTLDGIVGGFPCQDISHAGKGAGLAGERSGLFFEIVRLVRLVRPRFVYLENVAALTNRGLSTVLGEFAAIGYDAEWSIIPCSVLGGSHKRERVWIIAYPMRQSSELEEYRTSRQERQSSDTSQSAVLRQEDREAPPERDRASFEPFTHSNGNGCNDRSALERGRLSQVDGERNSSESQSERKGWECEFGSLGSPPDSNGFKWRESNPPGCGMEGELCVQERKKDANGLKSRCQSTPPDSSNELRAGSVQNSDGAQQMGFRDCRDSDSPNPAGKGLEERVDAGQRSHQAEKRAGLELKPKRRSGCHDWPSTTQSLVRGCHDGIPAQLDNDQAYLLRLADLPNWLPFAADSLPIAYRKEALQAYGNAIVPQVGAIGFLRIYEILEAMQ